MIKDIFRGAFRSFSRTIGRILAYIALGFLLSLLLGKCDVHAMTYTGLYPKSNPSRFYIETQSNYLVTGLSGKNLNTIGLYNISNYIIQKDYTYHYKVAFTFTIEPTYSTSVVSGNTPNCSNWSLSEDTYLGDRLGVLQTELNRTWKQESCTYDGFKSQATYILDVNFKATDSNSYITFMAWFNSPSWIWPNSGYELTLSFDTVELSLVSDNSSDVIDNANQNTNDIINNDKQNTQDIINNQNKNQEQTNEKLEEVNETNKGIFGFVEKIWNGIVNLPQNIWNLLKGGFEMIGGFISDMLDAIKGIFLPEAKCEEGYNLFTGTTLTTGSNSRIKYDVSEDGIVILSGTGSGQEINFFQGELHLKAGTYTFDQGSITGPYMIVEVDGKRAFSFNQRYYVHTFDTDVTITRMYWYCTTAYMDNSSYTYKFMILEGDQRNNLEYQPPDYHVCEEVSFWTWFQRLGDMIGNFFLELLNGIKRLFIPDDFDFLDGFLDALEEKLGFIASIPIQLIEFLLDLPNFAFKEVTSVTLPKIEILGVSWWDSQEIDFTEMLNVIKPFRYLTDLTAIILFINGLMKYYDGFANGG